jgi:hypothetical protein
VSSINSYDVRAKSATASVAAHGSTHVFSGPHRGFVPSLGSRHSTQVSEACLQTGVPIGHAPPQGKRHGSSRAAARAKLYNTRGIGRVAY